MNVNQKWYHQTFVIVAAFVIFWPVGIYFLVSRNNATKQGMCDLTSRIQNVQKDG